MIPSQEGTTAIDHKPFTTLLANPMTPSNADVYGVTGVSSNSIVRDILLRKGFYVQNLADLNIYDEISQEIGSMLDSIVISESDGIWRAPFVGSIRMLKLILSKQILDIVRQACPYLVLNQQNAVFTHLGHGQDRWHRDIPYQHWIPNGLAAINILFLFSSARVGGVVLDIIEGSHAVQDFPCWQSIDGLSTSVTLEPYQFLVMNSFLYHRASALVPRGAVLLNQVFAPKIFSRQVDIGVTGEKMLLSNLDLLGVEIDSTTRSYLGMERSKYLPGPFCAGS